MLASPTHCGCNIRKGEGKTLSKHPNVLKEFDFLLTENPVCKVYLQIGKGTAITITTTTTISISMSISDNVLAAGMN